MKLLRLIKDFREWRAEKYNEAFSNVLEELAGFEYSRQKQLDEFIAYQLGIVYGINHRKEILKKVKI